MISVSDEVLARWGALTGDGQFDIDLQVLVSRGAAGAIKEVLREIIEQQVTELNAVVDATRPQAGQEPPWPGEWRPVELPDGSVALRIFDCDRLDLFLPIVAEGLERAGIGGEIVLCQWPVPPRVPARAPVFECRMLVRGERTQRGPATYGWRVDPDALSKQVDRTVAWLTGEGQLSAAVLTAAALPPVPLATGTDLATKFRDLIDQDGLFDVLVQTSGGFRVASWTTNHAQIALIDVGPVDWRGPRNTFRSFLEDSSADIAYGYIRHGSSPARARHWYALETEWPPRGGAEQAVYNQSATSWWNEYIPDALELQLLGPGHAPRIPAAPSYDKAPVGGSFLLEHRDPAAWYETPFVPRGVVGQAIANVRVPPVLEGARAELRPLLFDPGLLAV